MKGLLSDIHILLIVVAAVLTVGCVRDGDNGDPENYEETIRSLYIRLHLIPEGDKSPGSRGSVATRADMIEGETPGTSGENAINAVSLLIYDANTDTLVNVAYLSDVEVSDLNTPEGACVPVIAKTGQGVRIYAAVNMPEQMVRRFEIGHGPDASYSPPVSDNSYSSVMNEYVPGSNGKQSVLETLDKGGIPMTGKFIIGDADTGSDVIVISESNCTKENALRVTAKVSRLVAKIHVIATPEIHEAPVYARAMPSVAESPSEPIANSIGWIRLENVRYIPNGINRSTYILPRENTMSGALSGFMDMNMSLDGYVSAGEFPALLWSDDYVYLEGKMLHSVNVNSVMEHAETYNAGRLAVTLGGNDDTNRYVRGMYCLENYFDMPADDKPFRESLSAIPMITSVVITAKLAPRVLLVEKDFKSEMDDFVYKYENNPASFLEVYQLTSEDFSAEDANYWKEIRSKFDNLTSDHGCFRYEAVDERESRFILNSSLKMHRLWSSDPLAYESGKYSEGTYYVYDQEYDGGSYTGLRYLCLTAGAVSESNDENVAVRARSVPHIGGWGYYYTYINNNGSANQNGRPPYTASQVTRNSYYIITVNNFSTPGGTVTSPDYIRVNTDKVGWDYSGRGDINLH